MIIFLFTFFVILPPILCLSARAHHILYIYIYTSVVFLLYKEFQKYLFFFLAFDIFVYFFFIVSIPFSILHYIARKKKAKKKEGGEYV